MRTQTLSSIKLRQYQAECVEKIEKLFDFLCTVSCYCLVLPTGAGKSVIIGAVIDSIFKTFEWDDLSILVCSWSRRIVKQDYEKCEALNTSRNVVYSQISDNKFVGKDRTNGRSLIDFCTVQSMPNFNVGKCYDVIIVDECHKMYVGTAGYKEIVSRMRNSNGELRNKESDTIVLGLTATPYRNRKESVLDQKMFVPVEDPVT